MTAPAGDAAPPGPPAVIRASLQGKYAGFASRFTAFAVDIGISLGVFMLALAAISFAATVLTGTGITWHKGDLWVIITYAAWAFTYFAYSWAASGRTAGMALLGVRVVREDGTAATGRRAVVRTLALPLSFLFLGLGFAGHPAGRPAPRPARRHRRHRRHLLLGRPGRPAAVPHPELTPPLTRAPQPSEHARSHTPPRRQSVAEDHGGPSPGVIGVRPASRFPSLPGLSPFSRSRPGCLPALPRAPGY